MNSDFGKARAPWGKLVLASNNTGKLREFRQLFSNTGIQLLSQSEMGVSEAEETGQTFVENAIIKARNACAHSGLPSLADDSGIEVDALEGQPGVYSARYAGQTGPDADLANNRKLLEELSNTVREARTARYQCVIVYMRHQADPTPLICSGSWEGRILLQERGEHGFGYDPLFFVPSHDCSSAELDPQVKNRISHRGKAIQQLLTCWNIHP